MNGDSFWVGITILLDLVIFSQYILIAYVGYKHLKKFKRTLVLKVFAAFVGIFIFCGICGYLAEVIRLYWPAYRLFALMKIALVAVSQIFIIYAEKINFFAKLLIGQENLKEIEKELAELYRDSKRGSNV